jgi:hypothetical protein
MSRASAEKFIGLPPDRSLLVGNRPFIEIPVKDRAHAMRDLTRTEVTGSTTAGDKVALGIHRGPSVLAQIA